MSDQSQAGGEPEELSQTERYLAWRDEEDGEPVFHLDLGAVTLHFNAEDWAELLELMRPLV